MVRDIDKSTAVSFENLCCFPIKTRMGPVSSTENRHYLVVCSSSCVDTQQFVVRSKQVSLCCLVHLY